MTPCFDERHSHAVTTNAFEAPARDAAVIESDGAGTVLTS
jgi:hypothetical protein